MIVKGKGMPHKNDPETFGDLHLKMKVQLPSQLSEVQVKEFSEILSMK